MLLVLWVKELTMRDSEQHQQQSSHSLHVSSVFSLCWPVSSFQTNFSTLSKRKRTHPTLGSLKCVPRNDHVWMCENFDQAERWCIHLFIGREGKRKWCQFHFPFHPDEEDLWVWWTEWKRGKPSSFILKEDLRLTPDVHVKILTN